MTIEIELGKLERGTREGMVRVNRGGTVFRRKQRLGTKESTAPVKAIGEMTNEEISTAFVKGKPLPLTVDTITSDRHSHSIKFKETGWHAVITTRHITKEKQIPGRVVVEWRKYYQETNMELYNGNNRIGNYDTASVRTDVDDKEAARIKVTKGAELVRKRLEKSFGLKLEYDDISHNFQTEEQVERGKRFAEDQRLKEEKVAAEEAAKVAGQSPEVKQIKRDLDELVAGGNIGDIFKNNPEIIYNFIERIMTVKDEAYADKPAIDIFDEPAKYVGSLVEGEKVLAMAHEDAYIYISDPTNRQKVSGILSSYMDVIK